jgi:hypothetical protein
VPAARHSSQYFKNTTVEWMIARVRISRHFYHPRVGPILPGWVGGAARQQALRLSTIEIVALRYQPGRADR